MSRSKLIQPRVVVIGGGLVGASFALALGQLGIKTLVLEAHRVDDSAQPSFDERTVALTRVSRHIYDGLQVWSDIADEATAIKAIHVSDRGHFGATRLDSRDAGCDALGFVIANRSLGRGLHRALARHACVQVVAPATVSRLAFNDDATAPVVIESSVGDVQAELVVIADGGRSQLAQQAGLIVREKTYEQLALVTRVRADRDHNGCAFERFTSDGPLALLPIDQRDYAVAWTLSSREADSVRQLGDADFLRRLQRTFGGRAGHFTSAAPRLVYPLKLATLASPVARRVAVIGNAAHTVHPVAGQGFNLGLRDVATLAERLSSINQTGESPGDSAVLADYASARRTDTRAVSWFTDGLINTFTHQAPPVVVARNLVLSGLTLLPGVRRELLHRTMGLKATATTLTRGQPLTPVEVQHEPG